MTDTTAVEALIAELRTYTGMTHVAVYANKAADALRSLLAERDALKADAERLDFVMDHAAIAHWSKDHEYCWLVREIEDDGQYATERMVRGCFNTPREAIDAAHQVSKEQS